MSLQTPDVNVALLERIQLGLLEEQQLRCRYYAAHQDKERELILNPLALVQRGSTTYLIATAEPYSDIRQYALHRFREVQVLDMPLTRAEGFSLQAYLDSDALQFGAQRRCGCRLGQRYPGADDSRDAAVTRHDPGAGRGGLLPAGHSAGQLAAALVVVAAGRKHLRPGPRRVARGHA